MRKEILLSVLMLLIGTASIAQAVPIESDLSYSTSSSLTQAESTLDESYSTHYCYMIFDTSVINSLQCIDLANLVAPSLAPAPVPEPSTAMLLLVGMIGSGCFIFWIMFGNGNHNSVLIHK
jgi:hypothetical protein